MVSRRVHTLLEQLRAQGIRDEHVWMRSPQCRVKSSLMRRLNIRHGIISPCRLAGADHLTALYGGSHDRAAGANAAIAGSGNWYRLWLPDGYLAHLVHHVCSVERIKGLQWQARRRLKQLDLHNVSTRHGDGWQGWQARAPFDAIIVTAAPPEIPTALMMQLDEGGVLVLPVGDEHQFLKRVRRRGGEFIIDTVEAVRFVPLVKGELA